MKQMDKRTFLEGKLRVPLDASVVISRARFHSILDNDTKKQCISLVAPAGFGKTTLVSGWLKSNQIDHVWLTLESSDNSLFAFWKAFVMACSTQGFHTQTAKELKGCLDDEIGSKEWVNQLINELSDILSCTDRRVALVLDDVHHINNASIESSIARIIRFLPKNVTLYCLSRTRLPKKIQSFVSSGRFSEVSADDLVFSMDEGLRYIEKLKPNALRAEEVSTLLHESGGWPIFFCQAVTRRIKTEGYHSYAISAMNDERSREYIQHNILDNLSNEIRSLVINLAPFSYFNLDMCRQSLYPSLSESFIEQLVSQHCIMSKVPGYPERYRIREPLRTLLSDQQSSNSDRHIRFKKAYHWYLSNNAIHEAITLGLDFDYWQSSVYLIESQYHELVKTGKWCEVTQWFTALPNHIIQQRPLLLMLRAWAELYQCNPMKSVAYLNQAYSLLSDSAKRIDHPEQVYAKSKKTLAKAEIVRLKNAIHDIYMSRSHLQMVVCEGDNVTQKQIQFRHMEGLGALYNNRLQEAKLIFQGVLQQSLSDGYEGLLFQSAFALGWVYFLTGDMEEWESLVVSLKERLSKDGRLTPVVDAWLQCSMLLGFLERGEMTRNQFAIDAVNGYWVQQLPLDMKYQVLLTRALTQTAQKQYQEAELTLSEAEVIACELPPVVYQGYYSVSALRAELNYKRGNKEESWCWAESYSSLADSDSMAGQHESLVRAEILYSMGADKASLAYVISVATWAKNHDHHSFALRALILESLLASRKKNNKHTQALFDNAIIMGRLVGAVTPFVIDYADSKPLLTQARHTSRYPSYISKLMAIIKERANGNKKSPNEEVGLEVLSKREKEVLALMATGISNPEIANSLCRSLGTVKIHVHNIYRKLGVVNRVTAINRYFTVISSSAA